MVHVFFLRLTDTKGVEREEAPCVPVGVPIVVAVFKTGPSDTGNKRFIRLDELLSGFGG
jgi:hypothetical protein